VHSFVNNGTRLPSGVRWNSVGQTCLISSRLGTLDLVRFFAGVVNVSSTSLMLRTVADTLK
jgi:hypothetical protein